MNGNHGIINNCHLVEIQNIKEEEIIVCRTECFDNEIFVWNIKDDTFIGQGKSVEEIIKIFMTKYPNTSMKFNWKAENE